MPVLQVSITASSSEMTIIVLFEGELRARFDGGKYSIKGTKRVATVRRIDVRSIEEVEFENDV